MSRLLKYKCSIGFVVVIAAPLFLGSGCTKSITKPEISNQQISGGRSALAPITLHGNFCGPDHPHVSTGSSLSNVIELMKIKPRDDLDAACQRHDICYEVFGFFDRECDRSLVDNVRFIDFPEAPSAAHCHGLKGILSDLAPKTGEFRLPIISDGLGYVFTFIKGLAGSVENNVLWPLLKAETVLRLIQNYNKNSSDKLNLQKFSAIAHADQFCFDQNEQHGIFLELYRMYFLDALTEILLTNEYIEKPDAYKLRNIFLPSSIPQDDAHNQLIKYSSSFPSNPVLAKQWSLQGANQH
jgi:hypothetical protein